MEKLTILIVLICALFLNIFSLNAQTDVKPLVPNIDKRLEFLSIVYHLAKADSVPDSLNKTYADAINKHFAPYRQHSLLRHLKKAIDSLETINGDISSWEIPSLAVHLSYPPRCSSLVPFTFPPDTSDGWDNRTLLTPTMLVLLNAFYDTARCEAFFSAQAPYYKRVEQEYRKRGIAIKAEWIQQFFATPLTETYYPILALGTRDDAYLRTNLTQSRRNTYSIFSARSFDKPFDKQGIPTNLSDTAIPQMMLHEYIHCFANHLIDTDSVALKPFAETILSNPTIRNKMKNTFYGNWKYLLYESLVRAVTIRYNMSSKEFRGMTETTFVHQETAGFFWMRDLVRLLGEYENSRKEYRTFFAFMPKVRQFFANIADEARK